MAIELVPPDISPSEDVSPETEISESCVALLEKTLEEVRSGDTEAVLLVTKSVDGTWSMNSSDYIELAACLGQLEMLKFNLVLGSAADDDCDCDCGE